MYVCVYVLVCVDAVLAKSDYESFNEMCMYVRVYVYMCICACMCVCMRICACMCGCHSWPAGL